MSGSVNFKFISKIALIHEKFLVLFILPRGPDKTRPRADSDCGQCIPVIYDDRWGSLTCYHCISRIFNSEHLLKNSHGKGIINLFAAMRSNLRAQCSQRHACAIVPVVPNFLKSQH